MNLLEREADRLKREYGPQWHATIDRNLEWVTREMEAHPGSIAVQEGLIALSPGLPAAAGTSARPKASSYKRVGGKRLTGRR